MNAAPCELNLWEVEEPPPPPPPPLLETQHLKFVGPGHCPERVVPEQEDVQRQSPELPQCDFVQHFTSAGSFGQKPAVEVPLPSLQSAVWTQTPETPLTEHGPLTAAKVVAVRERRASVEMRKVIVMEELF